MYNPSGGEGPTVLQLQKWPPSGIQLNLSEFREAFISPSRKIISLLSNQCESLLLPLVTGGSKNNNLFEGLDGQCAQNAPDSRPGSMENLPCTSGSAMGFDDDISPESNNPNSGDYPFICNVKSLAWGVSGDTYNHHGDASFGDLLFVSSNHGVTVHAFCQPAKSSEIAVDTDGEFGSGRWVEWGPSNASDQNIDVPEPSSSYHEATEGSIDVKRANGIDEHSYNTCKEAGNDGLSRSVTSKRWLRSFFTEVETVTSDGGIWTKFPEKSSFPCRASVVSFSIFDTVNDTSITSKPGPSSLKFKSEVLSKFVDVEVGSSWKCSRVLSSISHHLIGFVLTSLDPIAFSDSDVSEKNRSRNLIVVSRLDSWGMQWVSSVKLEGILNNSQMFEWTDFRFSDDLLVCLNASGLIYFYAITTGEYVSHLDIVHTCRLDLQPSMLEQEEMSVGADIQLKHVDKVLDKSTSLYGEFRGKQKFKKLVLAAYTSLLAVVDDNGVIYVICVGDYIPANFSSSKKLLPHFQHLGLGMLIGWEVGGSEIGRQRVYSESGSYNSSISSIKSGCLCFLDNIESTKLHEVAGQNLHGKRSRCDSCMSGFSAVSKIVDQRFHDYKSPSYFTPKIFLPTNRFSVDDCICISPLGITQLIRKHSMKDRMPFQIVHFDLHADLAIRDDRCLNSRFEMSKGREKVFFEEAVACTFQGCFYLVTQDGLSVVLPPLSVSTKFMPMESIGYQQPSANEGTADQVGYVQEMKGLRLSQSPWIVELLDKTILYEGPEVADHLCLENGWDLKISRMRRLQIALDYLKYQEIEQSLEMLVDVNMAEEGILRLLFATVDVMFHKVGSDNEVSAALRLLVLATHFATKMIRNYGLLQYKKDAYVVHGFKRTRILPLPPILADEIQNETGNSKRLCEMAQFLEIIRNLQCRLSGKLKRPGQGMVDDGKADTTSQDESQLSVVSMDPVSLETPSQNALPFSVRAAASNNTETLALMPVDSEGHMNLENTSELSSALVLQDGVAGKRALPLENPKEMIARWKLDNLDLKTIVKDALLSGRLPLAVLQLHLHRAQDILPNQDPQDTFTEVRDIGRAIAYDLFLKDETELAVATLQRLGEDLETSLKQLLFGTVRRSLRIQIIKEMKKYGYLGPFEWKILETISLIERLYPSTSFWKTFLSRQKELMRVTSGPNAPGKPNLHVLHSSLYNNLIIECGEIDGVVLGSWTSMNESSVPSTDEDSAHVGYWTAAAIWSNSWDQRTIDRIVLDQPFHMGVHVSWESQLVYHVSHNDWQEVSKILDLIPSSVLSHGNLQINLDQSQPTSKTVGYNGGSSDYGSYICSIEELDAVCMDIPDVRIFKFPADTICSTWLRRLMEQELAKKFIFLKEYWEGTAEIIPLLACSGLMTKRYEIPFEDVTDESSYDIDSSYEYGTFHGQALHKLFVRHCAQYNLPNLLDIYLDHHNLVADNDSLTSLLEAAGDCQWARWLLLSRIKGREYDASFANARAIMSCNVAPDSNLSVLEVDEIIHTVDDIAEGGGELAALATLMYAPVPIQNCLSTGSVNRHSNSSAQCTLENLRPTLQRYPTLWRTLVAACFGQDTDCNFLAPKANIVYGDSALVDYLDWRDNIFFSTGRDTSLLQMLPCWFPKSIRRLIQLYVQGPLGWQSLSGLPTSESYLHRDFNFFINSDEQTEISEMSWEATIQKHVEEELYDSALEETGLGLEHHLHRGRPLAAFNHLLAVRIERLKSEGQSGATVQGQTNVQADVQTLLAPITLNEESLISSVMPLAIMHFDDSVLVASCAFLLELCGLSASMLRIDIVALRRISSFYKTSQNTESYKELSRSGSALHTSSLENDITESLARALADEYLHQNSATTTKQKETYNSANTKQPLRALMLVLQHLEKASLPQIVDGTCGSWLLSGNGDGAELRSQQKAASQHWNLVTVFCQMHQLPLSTKYLAALAKDNDWVGFLSEAQVGGYPFDKVVEVASKEFSDARLKVHIVTVLKGLHSRKKASSSSFLDTTDKASENSSPDEQKYVAVELFAILAECEKQKNPGEALLVKAKDLSWSLLAMIASCFPDVSPLSCLTVWLEITAARETSSVKVNDIASQIASNVGAAVEATNSLPAGSRALAFHYNRRNAKRRRLLEPLSVAPLTTRTSDASNTSAGGKVDVAPSITVEEERKIEIGTPISLSNDSDEGSISLSKMVAVLCEQHLFLPLLRAFDMFLPSCSLLPFIRALQAFSQMRLSEASAHLGSFSARIKEEPVNAVSNTGRDGQIGSSWISATAVTSADAMLSTCPSPYERRCLLQLLAATDFGDGGSAAAYYRRCYWKINLAEPLLRKDDLLHLGNETLDDASLLAALENSGHWEQARTWAKQLEASGGTWKSAVHHVTETQAESMVAEWKEFLWDVPEERVALWSHCQTLFIRYSFPPLQAGLFFLKHAEAVEKDIPARELHELLLLSVQWLSGMITLSNPVYPLHILREIETRVWLLAVESEAQVKSEGDLTLTSSARDHGIGNRSNIIDRTASIITKMDSHINIMKNRTQERQDARDNNQILQKNQGLDTGISTSAGVKPKRRAKGYAPSRRPLVEPVDKNTDPEDGSAANVRNESQSSDENCKLEMSFSRWEERVQPAELERAVLSLLEFGQVTAAKQLQHKLSPGHVPSEFTLVDAALKLAAASTPQSEVPISMIDEEVRSVIQFYKIPIDLPLINPLQVLENLATRFTEGCGQGLSKRIIAVVKAANVLGLSFSEAFDKQPIEVFQLLSLKAQESFEEAKLMVQTHSMPAASVAQILAESFLKGLLAAHRGGYMDSQKEEGPAPLLWRFSDFLKWAELCPSEPEIGHALMRLVITGQEIPHACEVELLILSHHFYKSSACLDGVDVLVALAATRVEAYVSEGDFPCLARLITGVGNFHALNFILGILIENGQLDLLLQKYSAAADINTGTAEAVRGFRMAVLTSLKHFNPNDLDAFAMVYNHFDMKHETAALLESRAEQSSQLWFHRYDKDQNEDLLDSMRYFIEAAEVHTSIDAGNKTHRACAQASLVSLQIRMPDFQWLNLSETNARRALVEQSRFQEALIVAEAYGLNQPSEWALVLWNQMLKPELTEEFVAEFVAVLPLQPSMLIDLARFYRAEVAARGDQSQFSVWLTGGGLPAEWAKYLERSFRCLLKRTRDLRLRSQLASVATGFLDVIDGCLKALDKVPDSAGPLVLRKGHGGAYLPLM